MDDIRNEAELRGSLLTFLYERRKPPWANVKPDSFSPPWTEKDITYYDSEFHKDGLTQEYPSRDGRGGFWIRISDRGKLVWERRAHSDLDIDLPPR